ncbi:hypothetical protein GCM10009682_32810 [Luedemannella flava]|uniref:Uncharacterized protein n=1 Tax=Luedemannella flava TaxID=349316 RepID=A0ABP4YDK9_9ACTN
MADLPEQSTPAGPSETPSTGTPPARPKGRKAVRTVLPIVAFAIVGVAAALLTTGIFVYQKATEPDRSTPTVSVQQLLTAIFVEEDNTRAGLFVCSEWSGDKAATAIKQQIDSEARVSWEGVKTADTQGDRATVELRMLYRYPEDVTPSGGRYWTFDLVKDGGWRVCGAHLKP